MSSNSGRYTTISHFVRLIEARTLDNNVEMETDRQEEVINRCVRRMEETKETGIGRANHPNMKNIVSDITREIEIEKTSNIKG